MLVATFTVLHPSIAPSMAIIAVIAQVAITSLSNATAVYLHPPELVLLPAYPDQRLEPE